MVHSSHVLQLQDLDTMQATLCLLSTALHCTHKCFKCWWLALPEKKRITKPLINSTLEHGLHEGPSYTVLAIIKELLRQFKS